MSARKTGQDIACKICGTLVYRQRSHILRGVNVTCGKRECVSASVTGENNPFWGKNHSPEMREKIKAGQRAHPPKGTGPKKGVFKPRRQRREPKCPPLLGSAGRLNREKMLSYIPKGAVDHPYHKMERERRYRVCFTRFHKRDWQADKCAYCEALDGLVLDHIIPAMAGGKNVKSNAQDALQDRATAGKCDMLTCLIISRP